MNSFIGTDLFVEECMTQIKDSCHTQDVEAARITGTYEDYIRLMVKTHKEKGERWTVGELWSWTVMTVRSML